jgi:hypothetical protein
MRQPVLPRTTPGRETGGVVVAAGGAAGVVAGGRLSPMWLFRPVVPHRPGVVRWCSHLASIMDLARVQLLVLVIGGMMASMIKTLVDSGKDILKVTMGMAITMVLRIGVTSDPALTITIGNSGTEVSIIIFGGLAIFTITTTVISVGLILMTVLREMVLVREQRV